MAATATKSDRVSGLFDQAVLTFGDTLKAGVKIQEEVGKWWSDALEQAGPGTDWQKKSRALVSEAIPAAQKNAKEWLKLVEQNYKRSMALLKKAFDTNGDPAELRVKTQHLWEESMELIRDNAQAMADANKKVLELWAGMLKKNIESVKVK
jgi:hypothetical protein